MKRFALLTIATAMTGFCIAQEMTQEQMMQMVQPPAEMEQVAWMIGDWTTVETMYQPGMDPITAKGSSTFKMGLNGRYLMQMAKGDMMGIPFEGLLMLTYDQTAGKWKGIWYDSFTPDHMVSWGTYDEETDTAVMLAEDFSSMGIPAMDYRVTIERVNDDKFNFKLEGRGDDDEWFTMMDSVYTRVE